LVIFHCTYEYGYDPRSKNASFPTEKQDSAGEEVVIARGNKPLVKIVALKVDSPQSVDLDTPSGKRV
jgi:hypothetical protein